MKTKLLANVAAFITLIPTILLSTTLPTWAEHKDVDLRLSIRDGESFEVLIRKAETLARTAAQMTFDREILVSDVSVKITAQNQDQAAMVLQLVVSRANWINYPDPKAWATYFPGAQTLMRIK
ncbi:hypothetical protein V2H45_11650 [Tumidithrix elongata RA019]|uniref:Uncharacterized protein n=1 Tax=Tumidithrix elongata BACA0141 TaxID=2716417 RepID=A0AAW9Q3E1_9CYAN|nr:hypothetical protein [Tumidithrix elongata RA019]